MVVEREPGLDECPDPARRRTRTGLRQRDQGVEALEVPTDRRFTQFVQARVVPKEGGRRHPGAIRDVVGGWWCAVLEHEVDQGVQDGGAAGFPATATTVAGGGN
ncbi:MAG: hypothetical protein R2705_18975 [Ilumatobacteraceae bacterium]